MECFEDSFNKFFYSDIATRCIFEWKIIACAISISRRGLIALESFFTTMTRDADDDSRVAIDVLEVSDRLHRSFELIPVACEVLTLVAQDKFFCRLFFVCNWIRYGSFAISTKVNNIFGVHRHLLPRIFYIPECSCLRVECIAWYRPEVTSWVNRRRHIGCWLINLILFLSPISDRRDGFDQIVVVMVTDSRIAFVMLPFLIIAPPFPISEQLLVFSYAWDVYKMEGTLEPIPCTNLCGWHLLTVEEIFEPLIVVHVLIDCIAGILCHRLSSSRVLPRPQHLAFHCFTVHLGCTRHHLIQQLPDLVLPVRHDLIEQFPSNFIGASLFYILSTDRISQNLFRSHNSEILLERLR